MIAHFFQIALGYWHGATRSKAWLLSLGFLFCLIANLLLSLEINQWSKSFFDALQFRRFDEIIGSMKELAVLVVGSTLVAIATLQCRMRLQLGWRVWLMSHLMQRWLHPSPTHDIPVSPSVDNPEARIADDGRISVELFVDLAGGVINTFLVSASFIVVLWKVGGSYEVYGVSIPGYLVFAVCGYTAVTTFGMALLGRPLVNSVEKKAAAEGYFRYALTQARQYLAEATHVGDRDIQDRQLESKMKGLIANWHLVILGQTKLVIISSANNLLAPAVPLLLCAPKYMSGTMTLGDLIQAAAAFVQVQTSLNWLSDNALSLANWSASAHRVAALDEDMNIRIASVEKRGI